MLNINGFTKRVIITLVGFGLLIAFQNCSPMKASLKTTTAESQKAATDGEASDQVSTDATQTEDETSEADTKDTEKEKTCKKHGGDKADKEIADYYIKECEDKLAHQTHDKTEVGDLQEATNIRGNQSFYGIKEDSKIGLLHDIRGYTLVCGADVKEASNIRGSLIIVKGSVQMLKDVRGRVRVIDGSVGQMEDVRGNLEVYSSK